MDPSLILLIREPVIVAESSSPRAWVAAPGLTPLWFLTAIVDARGEAAVGEDSPGK